jgi:oxygen-dependent protoporphyrinogen oxidase
MNQVVIVGAGISGLATGFRLQQTCRTANITVLEQSARPGGTIWTERQDGFQVEIGPNGLLDNKPFALQLCHDLGLGDHLVPASETSGRNRYLFWQGKLQLLPRSLRTFLTTPLLSWRGKVRLLAERWIRRASIPADESIDAFVRRRGGSEAAEVLADALVTGIYAGDPRLLSLPACFPRLAAFEREYSSVIRGLSKAARLKRGQSDSRTPGTTGQMWSLPQGLRFLIETLRDRLSSPPICGAKVCRLEKASENSVVVGSPDPATGWHGRETVPQQGGWIVQGECRDRWRADAIVLACPAHEQSAILRQLDPNLADPVGSIAYNRLAVVALGYRRADFPGALDGFGFIVPQRLKRDILGVQWCSSIFPQRAPDEMILLRAMCGGWNRPDMVDWDDQRLTQAVRAELQIAMRITAEPAFRSIIRWDRAIPQYHLGHVDLVAKIEKQAEQYPGLFLAGNAYHGVSLNDCIEQAEKLAMRICSFLASMKKE